MEVKYILIILSALIIFSYLFDMFARKTRFPSVILLIFTGIVARTIVEYYGVTEIPYLDNLIPVMGTIGLILIVLEGALELELSKEKKGIIQRGFLSAFAILLLCVIALSLVFQHFFEMSYESAVINAIPVSIISSAVAIPSASSLLKKTKEFVVYESTFSDILGIMLFNYVFRQFQSGGPLIGVAPIFNLSVQIVLIVVASLVVTFLLFELLQRINHNVKFFLILAILIFLYAIGKFMHLPSLVTIFIFGLFLSNTALFMPKFMKNRVDLQAAKEGLHEFHILTAESTFIVRTFFFLFFGFSITIDTFLDPMPYFYGAIILFIMFAIRFVYLLVTQPKEVNPLVFISPRGLITILLFLQVIDIKDPKTQEILVPLKSDILDEKVLLIVILGSMLIMLVGTLGGSKKEEEVSEESLESEPSEGVVEIAESGEEEGEEPGTTYF